MAGPATGGRGARALQANAQLAELHRLAESLTPDRAREMLGRGCLQPVQIGALMASGKLSHETMEFFIGLARQDAERTGTEVAAALDEGGLKYKERRELKNTFLRKKAAISRLEFFRDLQAVRKLTPVRMILLVGWSLAMSALDMTIVNICNPLIMKEPNFVPQGEEIPESTIQWINDVYSIAFASFAIPAAKLGDRYGVTVVHRWGVAGFVLFSTLCGLARHIPASSVPWAYGGFYILVGSRFFQGLTAAFLMSNSMSLCSILVEQKDIPTAMAMNSMAFAAATALGPPLGGVLGQFAGWDFCFYINIVIGIVSIAFCWVYLPKVPRFREEKFDYVGALTILASLILLVLGLTFIPPARGFIALGISLCICGIGGIVGFVFWELQHPFAILPRSILTNKKIMYSLVAGLWNFALIVTVSFQMPFAFQKIHQLEPFVVGLLSLVSPIMQIGASIVCQYLARHVTSFIIKLVSSCYIAVLIILLGYIVPGDIPWIVLCNSLISFGLGIFFTTNNQFMMQTATPDIRGMMGGCIQTFREAGYALGIALVNLVHDIYMGVHWKGPVPSIQKRSNPYWVAYSNIYYDAFATTDWCMSLVSLLAMAFALMSGTNVFEIGFLGYPKRLLRAAQSKPNAPTTAGPAPQAVKPEADALHDRDDAPLVDDE
ncbi:Multidrug MFS transporter [Giardia muris]|uniref:Multidrug MFS transporter n=1 Tax=Giardia muris TaxID=5742 RepID=A0A4Z1SM70_GIAMU|nr:Multidrug MFS transporter [Giardia muris]|eukprot:TNJ26660.1 Multidrug MFS transporter [Giardia muris]